MIHDHEVMSKQAAREELARKMAEWEARNGPAKLYAVTDSAPARLPTYAEQHMAEVREKTNAKRARK